MSNLSILGVPSSAGSYAAGQEQAPAVLRSAGLIEALRDAGIDVIDAGDLPLQVWHPDHMNPRAQNVDEVTESISQLIGCLLPTLEQDGTALVIGGNCTIALGVVAALGRVSAGRVGLLYLDRNYDLNTPESTTDGALDWMGMAHALDLPGCVPALVEVLGPRPLLQADQVAWLGVEDGLATDWERSQVRHLGLRVTSSESLRTNPAVTSLAALGSLPNGPLAVHFDVDVLDFTDAPLAENTDGRNTGPTLDQASVALGVAARDPRFRALSIGELNPTRSAGDPDAIPRFISALVKVLTPARS